VVPPPAKEELPPPPPPPEDEDEEEEEEEPPPAKVEPPPEEPPPAEELPEPTMAWRPPPSSNPVGVEEHGNPSMAPRPRGLRAAFVHRCRPNWLLLAIALTALSIVCISSSNRVEGFINRHETELESLLDTRWDEVSPQVLVRLSGAMRRRYVRFVDVKVAAACVVVAFFTTT
jgi:hypothetical protein